MSIRSFDDGWRAALWFTLKMLKDKKENYEHLTSDQISELLLIELGEIELPAAPDDKNLTGFTD